MMKFWDCVSAFLGMNNGLVPILAYNYGAGRRDRFIQALKCGICYAVGIMVLGVLIFQSIPHVLLGFFEASPEMLAIGVPALRTISLCFVMAGFSIICSTSFQALGNAVYSMIISIARQLVVLLPSAYLLSLAGNVDYGWSFPIAELVSLGMTVFFLIRINRNVIQYIGEEN